MEKMHRQGDLLFVQIAGTKLEGIETTDVTDGVLARGESTGHAHRIAPEDLRAGKAKAYVMDDMMEMEEPRRLVIEAYEQVRVLHEEHKPIVLERGTYEVRRQREATPTEIRYVAD
ncbi:hypothetical protein LM602_07605 [Candidatus Acetothermia bacterium]|jgi:phage terminase small subunit|nr:hypothetical protein [Candidatus Acetothermia bacterium]MCI2432399.1 hypothetical protein [Candidatus Acetothermia bacterium]MCI2436221.1 hypothetical protein [Candidatus Acetothermia bacterium]